MSELKDFVKKLNALPEITVRKKDFKHIFAIESLCNDLQMMIATRLFFLIILGFLLLLFQVLPPFFPWFPVYVPFVAYHVSESFWCVSWVQRHTNLAAHLSLETTRAAFGARIGMEQTLIEGRATEG